MYALNHLFFGIFTALLGLSLPGLINMTSVRMTLNKGLKSGIFYSAGGATTIFLQACLAVYYAGYLSKHLEVIAFLRVIAIAIFLILGLFFLYQGFYPKLKTGNPDDSPAFIAGMFIAALNILNIPFYFSSGSFLEASGSIELSQPFSSIFIIGIGLGGFTGLLGYAGFASYIDKKAQYIIRNLNFFLSALFIILAILQIIQIFNS